MSKDMSQTIQGIIVLVLGSLAQSFEIDLDEGQITEVATYLVIGIGALMSWHGRVRKGDITWYGRRK